MAGEFARMGAWARAWAFAAALALCGAAAIGAPAPRAFDLPAQPLRRALEQFDMATGISVLYVSDLADGRVSSPVRGSHTPDEALRLLIAGTGLIARAVSDRAFVLQAAAPDAPDPVRPARSPAGPAPYDAWVQRTVLLALCTRPETALGGYRAALSLRIDADGRVTQARLLDTTGDARRDAVLPGMLQGVEIGLPPPDASRPFVILILPRARAAGQACVAAP